MSLNDKNLTQSVNGLAMATLAFRNALEGMVGAIRHELHGLDARLSSVETVVRLSEPFPVKPDVWMDNFEKRIGYLMMNHSDTGALIALSAYVKAERDRLRNR